MGAGRFCPQPALLAVVAQPFGPMVELVATSFGEQLRLSVGIIVEPAQHHGFLHGGLRAFQRRHRRRAGLNRAMRSDIPKPVETVNTTRSTWHQMNQRRKMLWHSMAHL